MEAEAVPSVVSVLTPLPYFMFRIVLEWVLGRSVMELAVEFPGQAVSA